MAVAVAAPVAELCNENLDTVNAAIQAGVRRMDEFTWTNDEVQVVDMHELPAVDLQELRKASAEELGVMLKDLAKICAEWGFFRLLNHGVSNDMLQKIHEQTVRLFALPGEVKSKSPHPPTHDVGFYSGADGYGFDSKLWWQESFQLFCDPEFVDSHTQKLWPDGDGEEFSSTVKEYMRISQDLGLEMLHYVLTALKIDASKFLQHCRGSNCCLRLNHYPVCKRPEHVLGLFAHTDNDAITILLDDEVGGLQILKDNTWLPIKPQRDSLIVIMGDIMKVWSNEIYSSVVHRVIVNGYKRRISIAFVLYPEEETVIEPATELINAESPSKYKRFTFGEYRLSFYGGNTLKNDVLSQFELNK